MKIGWSAAPLLALAACQGSAGDAPAAPAEVSLTRLECGTASAPWPLDAFDDSGASKDLELALVGSCYLIRHGDKTLVWDTGIARAAGDDPESGFKFGKSLGEQLHALGVNPAKVNYVGVSHYHYDHVGQLSDLPKATLLVGTGDWAALTGKSPPEGADPKFFAPWITGGGKVEPVDGDKDVFGDGSVVMLSTPGHTPGHHSLLVKLEQTGPVLLTGDFAHFAGNYARDRVPRFNTDRQQTLASFARFKKMAADQGATVIIQHEPADVAKLPAFPAAAK
jgi:glyoxylase-like metal-dependent hydrolase (beta-lactamase superfamily II)